MTLATREQHYDVGVIVGRFQVDELHPMHRELIETVAAKHDRVIIFLGVSPIPGTVENPLNYLSRAQMLESAYPNIETYPVRDHASDEIWSQNLDSTLREILYPTQSAVLYGSRDSFIKGYHGTFPVRELLSEASESGSAVRKRIANSTPIDARSFRAGVIWSAANRFPQVHVTVDAAILSPDGSKLLLGRKKDEDLWRFIGGFVDIHDLSFEHAVNREVSEETGLLLNRSRFEYIGSVPIDDWRYRSASYQKIKTAFFLCHAAWGDMPKAGDDIAEVKWFEIETLTAGQIAESHRLLFAMFKEYIAR